MLETDTPAGHALKKAIQALQRGDKTTARSWAQMAASMQPDWEDPWLIMAALSSPHAGMAYLERALEINPESQRARAGLVWIHRQAATRPENPSSQSLPKASATGEKLAKPGAASKRRPVSPAGPSRMARPARHPLPLIGSLLVVLLVAIYMLWPRAGFPALAAGRSSPTMPPAGLLQATPTASPTQTFTTLPSESPTDTSSPSAADTPVVVPIPTATLTLIPLPTITPQTEDGTMGSEFVAAQIPASGEQRIVVNIHEQHLYAYQGDVLVFSFVASTGSNNSTRTGTFSILDKLPKAYAPDWNFWMPDWMGIYYAGDLEDGIHSLPLLSDGERLWGDAMGTPITYGCVVLGIQESRLLYNWAEVGTTVQINP